MIHLDNQTAIDKNEGHRSFPLISDIHDETQTGRTIQSVDRALRVFDAVASGGHGMTVSEISEKVGLNISTCHHLITTLVKRRFLTHLGRVRGYKLGPRINAGGRVGKSSLGAELLISNDPQKAYQIAIYP